MADDIFIRDGIIVTSFAGGDGSRAGRRERGPCYQLNEGEHYIELTELEAVQVAHAVLMDFGFRHKNSRSDDGR